MIENQIIESQMQKILNNFKTKIIKRPEYKDIYLEVLAEKMLEFANDESLPLELAELFIEFCELVIGIIDPTRADFSDLNR